MLQRVVARFADHGVMVDRALSDNGSAYTSHAWRGTCAELGITPKRTRSPPAADHRQDRARLPLVDGLAYARFYGSTQDRNTELPEWQHLTITTASTWPFVPRQPIGRLRRAWKHIYTKKSDR